MKTFILITAFLFITVVLMQQKNSSLGSMMGADSDEDIVKTRRGAEQFLHTFTVVLAFLFLVGTFYYMVSITE